MNKTFKNGCCSNPFKKDWEEGHDPLKPYIEKEDDKGEKIKIKPCSKHYDLVEMKDDEIGEFLNEEEKKYIKMLKKQRKEIGNRDLCKEKQEEKDELIKSQTEKIAALQSVVIQQNQVLAQIIEKIKNI